MPRLVVGLYGHVLVADYYIGLLSEVTDPLPTYERTRYRLDDDNVLESYTVTEPLASTTKIVKKTSTKGVIQCPEGSDVSGTFLSGWTKYTQSEIAVEMAKAEWSSS